MTPVRVRFAPSPTGYLHIGGLRTALYNYLFARRHGGAFILRIEDTDRSRFVADAEEDILTSLAWAGILFDEGPGKHGPFSPYRQSERGEAYREAAERLLANGSAYIAFDTAEEIDAMRARLTDAGERNPRYDSRTRSDMVNSLTLGASEVQERLASGEPHVVRLKVDPGTTVRFTDLIRGDVAFESKTLDDQVLVKSDGLPTYHLANVVDDHHMAITHVIRGEEWLPSTPKHMLLYAALGWQPPATAHLPLILSPSGGKLSKRSAERAGIPVSVRDYRAAGYEPEALVNFLALLGWNPGDEREIFSLEELAQAFSIERVGQSGVQFDLKKLEWFNEQYLRSRPAVDIAAEVIPMMEEEGLQPASDYLEKAIDVMRDRLRFASDLLEHRYLFVAPVAFDDAAVRKRWKEDSKSLVQAYADRLEDLGTFDVQAIESELRSLAEERAVGAGRIIHPVRLAVSGVPAGPGLFDLLKLLGKDESVNRMRESSELLG